MWKYFLAGKLNIQFLKNFELIDKNKNGLISKEEFFEVVEKHKIEEEKKNNKRKERKIT